MPFSLRLLAACVLTLISGVVSALSSGTAFVVAPGLLVTNHHVIEGCGAIECWRRFKTEHLCRSKTDQGLLLT